MIALAAVALVAVSAGLLTVAARRGPGRGPHAACLRVFLRCLGWGVATGAATGAVIGVLVVALAGLGNGASLLGLAPIGVLYGTIIGALVSVIPSVLGGLVVTGLIWWRHPQPSSGEALQGDLSGIFRAVVILLDAALLMAVIAGGAGLSSMAISLPFVVAGNACVVMMLCRARESIGRSWLEAAR